ncbi:hypothetical protein YC2023_050138 [Brassica napus]
MITRPHFSQVQTAEKEVCELSDSSPAKKKRAHSLSAQEIALHKALNRPDFPHYLLITSPPVDLWNLFSKTLKAARNVFHVTPSKLDFNNYFLLQLATPQQWTNTLHMIVLMHVLGERHKSVLLMHNSAFTTPELTSLMLSKDRQFQAATIVLTSRTQENPGRRFFRYGTTSGPGHLFKWVDEANSEELGLLADRQAMLEQDLAQLKQDVLDLKTDISEILDVLESIRSNA